jgi:hypothetical protein
MINFNVYTDEITQTNAAVCHNAIVNDKNTTNFTSAYSHKQLVLVAALVSTRALFVVIYPALPLKKDLKSIDAMNILLRKYYVPFF